MKKLYFEDYHVGYRYRTGSYQLCAEEIKEFARQWDPQPFHIDDRAAAESHFGGLTASSGHLFVIRMKLVNCAAQGPVVIAGLGVDGMRLHKPARPGDELYVEAECIGCRRSRSNPERGILKMMNRMKNQDDVVIMEAVISVMVACRGKGVG